MSQTSNTKSCLLKNSPPLSSSSSLFFSGSTLPNSPPPITTFSFFFSPPTQTTRLFPFVRNGGGSDGDGGGGGRPSPAGLFVPTCTCRKSGGMTQTGYLTLTTTIYTQTHPEPNTVLPRSMSGVGWGADGNESKDKERKAAKTDRCKDEITRRCLKYEQYVNSLLVITDRQMGKDSSHTNNMHTLSKGWRMCNPLFNQILIIIIIIIASSKILVLFD